MYDTTRFNEAECALRHVARVAEYHEVDVNKVKSVFDTMKSSIEVFARFASTIVASSPHARETTAQQAAKHT